MLHVEAYVSFGHIPPPALPAGWVTFVQTAHEGSGGSFERLVNLDVYEDARLDVWNFTTNSFSYAPGLVVPETWYRINFKVVTGSAPEARLWIEGEPAAALTGEAARNTLPINRLLIGITLQYDLDSPNEVFFDDLQVSLEPIDPLLD